MGRPTDRPLLFAAAALALSLLAGAISILHGNGGLLVPLLLLLLAGVLCALLVSLRRQRRMLSFLVEEKKRRSGKNAVLWDGEEAEKLGTMRRKVELHALDSQINPHFLYNTLDSIRSRALLDGQQEIASMTEILSKFFRYCIGNTEGLVKLREELSHIEDYYYIQKYRFEDRFEMETELESEELLEYYIPKMTLQPLVENAMIHGMEKVGRKGLLRLKVFQTERKLIVVVSDNGAGMNAAKLAHLNERMSQLYVSSGSSGGKHNGVAVTNVNTRLKLTFGEEYGIHYHSLEDHGTDAIVRLPLIDDFSRNQYLTETM